MKRFGEVLGYLHIAVALHMIREQNRSSTMRCQHPKESRAHDMIMQHQWLTSTDSVEVTDQMTVFVR
ncbi:hypothetical protein T265_06455 [Opisthorchis viverrini]|uniref:Uncharacterized protein n=1 Tax=Opisthorchis viverrini TaxID=6198 RepID=A0A074ZG55_OPIVI|nr:hypothetical protein T265_06455 [Opisthorchis viverrini]KER26261.1 hypothetical protein T265_06455 [Opisthorchis viverrini]